MALCQNCGGTVLDGVMSCPGCGKAVDRSIPCARCGFPVRPGMARCASCGRHLGQPFAYRTNRFHLQSSGGDVVATLIEAPDSDSSWPESPARRRVFGLPALGAKRTDPLFIAALLLAVASLAFAWMPRYNVSLAGIALIASLLGYQRFFSYKHRGRYGGLWINYLATAIGACGLVAGFGLTAFNL